MKSNQNIQKNKNELIHKDIESIITLAMLTPKLLEGVK